MKIALHMRIFASSDSIHFGGNNPVILEGRLEIEMTPEILEGLLKGGFSPSFGGLKYAKLSRSAVTDRVWVGETCSHLPKDNLNSAVKELTDMGFIFNVEATKHYPELRFLD